MGRSLTEGEQQPEPVSRHAGSPAATPASAHQPRVWLVLGDKSGDNRQVETLAEALGWICERKHIAMRDAFVYAKPRVRPSLHHIDTTRSDSLQPPWPDLIITVGRRPSMVALWIREQSEGHAKIVLLGKPSGRLQWYDLVISSAENAIAPFPNVIPITLPLMQVDRAAIAAEGRLWEEKFSALRKPVIGVLVGGPTMPFVYRQAMTRRVLHTCRQIAKVQGGTPYVTTSRRTPAALVETLKAELPVEARLFAWTPEAAANPYHGLLALADGFVVTADSISMAVEVALLRKPLIILPVPVGILGALDQLRRSFIRWLFAAGQSGPGGKMRKGLARVLYCLRLVNQTRDFQAFYRSLYRKGLAVPAGQDPGPAPSTLPDELPLVIARIRALIRGAQEEEFSGEQGAGAGR